MKEIRVKRGFDGRIFKCTVDGIDNLNITIAYKHKRNSLSHSGYILCLNRKELMNVPYKHYKKIYTELIKQIDLGYVNYGKIPLFQKYWGNPRTQTACAFK